MLVVDANNKFVETRDEAATEEEPLEAPIAESKIEEKKEDEKDEKVEGEDAPVDDKADSEDGVEDIPSNDEEPTEDVPSEEPVEEVPTEEPVEETPIEEIPLDLVPFEIDGVEYMLPQPVIDYINQLMGNGEALKAELLQMKEQIPSASPIPTVINQTKVDNSEGESLDLFSAIRLLNKK